MCPDSNTDYQRQYEFDFMQDEQDEYEAFIHFTIQDVVQIIDKFGIDYFNKELENALHRRLQATGIQRSSIPESGSDCPF